MDNNYPNLMCFGREPFECGCQNHCVNYEECKEEYHRQLLAWFEERRKNYV